MASDFHTLAAQHASEIIEAHERALAVVRKENEVLRARLFKVRQDAASFDNSISLLRQGPIPRPQPITHVPALAGDNPPQLLEDPVSLQAAGPLRKEVQPAPSSNRVDQVVNQVTRVSSKSPVVEEQSSQVTVSMQINQVISRVWWRKGWCLVRHDGRFMNRWDTILIAALVFTGIFTPWEVAFLEPARDAIFLLNCVLWLFFVADMFLQFFLVRTRPGDGVENVTSHVELMLIYLRGWFLIDFISVLPFDIISVITGNSDLMKLKGFRVLRLLRGVKILRIFRASRILTRWAAQISISHTWAGYMGATTMLGLGVHWMGCAWGLVGKEATYNYSYSWIDALAYDKPDGMELSNEYKSVWNVYLAGLHYAAMTITSIGFGDISPQQESEYACGIFFQCCGGIIWAVVIGTFCRLLTTSSPGVIRQRQTMDELNHMMSEQNLDTSLQQKLRLFFIEAYARRENEQLKKLLAQMSPALRAKVAGIITGRHVRVVWYIAKTSDEFIASVGLCLRTEVYIKGERMVDCSGNLCIVNRGVVTRCGAIKRKGSTWGEDFFLPSQLQYWVGCLALTFVEVLCLSPSDFLDCMAVANEHDQRVLRKAMLRLKSMRVIIANSRKELLRRGRTYTDDIGERFLSSMEVRLSSTERDFWGSMRDCATI